MPALVYLAAALAVLPMLAILGYLLARGMGAINLDLFTHMPRGVGEAGGGMANAITGTLILLGVACVVGLPVGLGAGLYLSDNGSRTFATVVRFLADVLNGVPSIVTGIVVWELVVRPTRHFSALAGGVALGVMMIPTVTRTTEAMVRLVPVALREAALALGYTRWRTSLSIVLRTALGGVVTGVLVAIARAAGETAPLLFTAFGNNFWSTSLTQPIAALPLEIFNYAISPYDEWHRLAWAGALVLVAVVFIISLAARVATRGSRQASD
jgi:phosphate transport system permease protein